MAKHRKLTKHIQLCLDQARRATGRGGWRPGAGRPRTRDGVSHDARERVSPKHPQHITCRLVEGIPSLRQRKLVGVLRQCIAKAQRDELRIVEFNVEGNHLHFIVEAASNDARSRGMQGLSTRLARCINRFFGRKGKVFADRYHARALSTPREVRNALRYVLNNARHHGIDPGDDWIDPCSSAAWFDGWKAEDRARHVVEARAPEPVIAGRESEDLAARRGMASPRRDRLRRGPWPAPSLIRNEPRRQRVAARPMTCGSPPHRFVESAAHRAVRRPPQPRASQRAPFRDLQSRGRDRSPERSSSRARGGCGGRPAPSPAPRTGRARRVRSSPGCSPPTTAPRQQ